jgi:hypothetical protein
MKLLLSLFIACISLSAVGIGWSVSGAQPVFAGQSGPGDPYGPNPHGGNPHGPDPSGDDAHDEHHDPDLPANKEQEKYKAPKDKYGGQFPS